MHIGVEDDNSLKFSKTSAVKTIPPPDRQTQTQTHYSPGGKIEIQLRRNTLDGFSCSHSLVGWDEERLVAILQSICRYMYCRNMNV